MTNSIAIKSTIRNKFYDLYVRREDLRSICADGLYSDAYYELSDDLQTIFREREEKFIGLRDLYFAYLEGVKDALPLSEYHTLRIDAEQEARDQFSS